MKEWREREVTVSPGNMSDNFSLVIPLRVVWTESEWSKIFISIHSLLTFIKRKNDSEMKNVFYDIGYKY